MPPTSRVSRKFVRGYKKLQARLTWPTTQLDYHHSPPQVVYTQGAALSRFAPKRLFTRSSLNLLFDIITPATYGDDAWTLVDDAPAKCLPVQAYPHVRPETLYTGKICTSLRDLDLDNASSASSPYSSVINSETHSTLSPICCQEVASLSHSSASPSNPSSTRSLSASWVPGQPLPIWATNRTRVIRRDSVGSFHAKNVCTTVLSAPPAHYEGRHRSRFMEDDVGAEVDGLCSVHNCLTPCGPCDETRPVIFSF
ncbi:hypothetical protein Hypma_009744 [Hypsizygus marmoreus]|uniref:Uncharacterized protein n=1 Tax=Hypsizygus marmoreus TaxID=39966 RepID=A0A369JLD5_HYPMA|nr:hypothetical protein Hypma_009744 [Hypsizygus marmoreus]